MRALVGALLAFPLLLAAQIAVWRLRRGGGHYAPLLGLALGVLVVSLAGFAGLAGPGPLACWLPASPPEAWTFAMLYGALVLAYMVTYSAVQADSPTMAILLRVEAAGLRGCSPAELLAELDDRVLVVPRLEDLVASGLAARQGERYAVRPGGALLARTYIAYRRLLRMEKGG